MHISIFELTVPQFILSLTSMKNILRKANNYAESKNLDMGIFFQSRLAPDQFPLGRQIQITCDVARLCAVRLSGQNPPLAFADDEKTTQDYLARIESAIQFLREFKPEHFEGYEKRRISFPWYPGHYLDGHNYLVQHALPNFYFHLTTAYSILRFNGVELGKADYLGDQNWKDEHF